MPYVYYPSNSNCGVVPPYQCRPCNVPELGRIRSIAIIDSSFVFLDPSNPVEWDAGILSGAIEVIWETQGSFDATTQELVGFGKRAFSNGGTTFTLTYFDPNTIRNINFYNKLRSVSDKTIAFVTETQVWLAGVPVTFTPKVPVQNDLLSQVNMEVAVKWIANDMPLNYPTPDGIFDDCYAVAP
jgi:hypothetical protein